MRNHVDRFNSPQLRGHHFRRYHQMRSRQRELVDRTAARNLDPRSQYEPLIIRLAKQDWRNG